MPDLHTFAIVALASLVLVVMPGPAVIYKLTRIVSQGRAAGLASALGVNLGSVFHVVAAVAGDSERVAYPFSCSWVEDPVLDATQKVDIGWVVLVHVDLLEHHVALRVDL